MTDAVLDDEPAVPQTPHEEPSALIDCVDAPARCREELRSEHGDQEDQDMAARGSTPPAHGDGDSLEQVPDAERGASSPSSGRREPVRRSTDPEQSTSGESDAALPPAFSSGQEDESQPVPAVEVASEPLHEDPTEDVAPPGDDDADGAEAPARSHLDAAPEQSAASTAAPPSSTPATGRDRRTGQRAPAWRDRLTRETVGIAVLVVLAVVCAALVVAVVVKTRDDAAAAAREAAAYQPPALSTPSPASTGATVAIVSDEGALRSGAGVDAAERWPQLLGDDDDVTTVASVGAGYATAGADERTFVQSAARVPADADVVLFVGGAADDQVSSLSLARAATQAFSAAAEQAPDAVIVAVGPLFRPSGTSETDLSGVRTTLRSAARIADVRWVDPITSDWVTDVAATSDLTAAQERALASRLNTLILGAVEGGPA